MVCEQREKPHALATEVNADEARYLTEKLAGVVTLHTIPGPLDTQSASDLEDIEILLPFIHSRVDATELALLPNLKFIATRSTGYDHVNVTEARTRSIEIANVPGYGETAVAEFTFALLLALSRKIRQAITLPTGTQARLEDLRGLDLYGKTLGVIGTGAIGLRVIRIATGFGMQVLAHDVRQNALLAEVLGFHYVDFPTILATSDIITLHAPALPETHHLFNRSTFSQIKQGALLINTARGSLVDTSALAWALDTHILAGAALDTLEGEEFLEHEEDLLSQSGAEEQLRLLVNNHILLRRPNVLITPHVAFNSEEALKRILDTTIANVKAFLAGKPQNLVPSL